MLNRISKQLTQILLKRVEKPNYDMDVYIYGFELIISTATGLLSILLLSMILSNLLVGIVFIISFVPLRLFTGGYHASTYSRCFMVSNITYMILIFIYNVIAERKILIVLFVLAAWYITKNAPKIHNNQMISRDKKTRSNQMVKKIMIIECCWLVYLGITQYKLMYMAILSICLVAAFMLLADNPIKKGVMEV